MTPEQLDQWEAQHENHSGGSQPACSRCQVLALIAEVRRLQAENEQLRVAARGVMPEAHAGVGDDCPWCLLAEALEADDE